jgi:Macrocin-O-methyltransferase (TylF)
VFDPPSRPSRRLLPAIITAVQADHLTYLEEEALRDLHEGVAEIERRGLDGALVEAGCALGGSAIVIATAKSPRRPFYVYDVFGMIPPPSDQDGADVHERYRVIRSGGSEGIGGHKYYGYESDLLGQVIGNFRRHGVPPESTNTHFVKGLFQEAMRIDWPVAFAHIDGDWYESVMTCLTRLAPRLVPGGVLVIDDYDAWSGCRRAVEAYFADKRAEFTFTRKARLQVVRAG